MEKYTDEALVVDWSAKGAPSKEHFKATIWDELSIDWTQDGCLCPSSVY